MEARETALNVVARISGTPREELTPEMSLVGDLGIDSPKALELLVELEEKLQIEISDDEAAGLNTVGDILSYLARAT